MKEGLCTIIGIVGGFIASLFGGWSAAMTVLLIFMGVDYITGLIVAGVFQRSNKSESGALESRAGWKGLCRKTVILLLVLVAANLEVVIGSSFIKDAVVIGFVSNEAISIIENAGLMGIPGLGPLRKAIEILKRKSGNEGEDDQDEPE